MNSEKKAFARFGQTNHNWSTESGYNRMFIQMQNQWANDILQARGHLFLNEVHDMLGIPRTPEGQLLGWLFHDGVHVEFGISDLEDGSIDLEFNVQGEIYNKI